MDGSRLRFRLAKKTILRGKKKPTDLFQTGGRLGVSGITLIHNPATDTKAGVLFIVPKRKIPKAHDRNRIKRLLREAYRLMAPTTWSTLHPPRHIAFLWQRTDQLPLPKIQKALETLFHRLLSPPTK